MSPEGRIPTRPCPYCGWLIHLDKQVKHLEAHKRGYEGRRGPIPKR